MAEPQAKGGEGGERNASATEQKAVNGWLADLARGSRLWIRGTVVAGTIAGLATIIQMVLLARIIHLGVIDEVPVADLTPLFLSLILALVIRALGQGFQTRFAARCSEQVRRDAAGAVTGLLVEIEDSEPDRYVEVPLDGLTVTEGGVLSDAALQTELTAQDLAAMPDAAI